MNLLKPLFLFCFAFCGFFFLQLQTAEQAALEKKGSVSAARDELEAVKQRVETLSAQLQQNQSDVSPVCACPIGQTSS